MLKISKLTDYALVLLSEMQQEHILSAQHLSQVTRVPLATTNKLLKMLTSHGICQSKSGKMGGFSLAYPKESISLLQIIHSIEGNSSKLTQCTGGDQSCQLIGHCKITQKMNLIDKEISQVLGQKFLSDLSN